MLAIDRYLEAYTDNLETTHCATVEHHMSTKGEQTQP